MAELATTTTLRNALKLTGSRGYYLSGEAYGDTRRLFEDGRRHHTSYIDRQLPDGRFLSLSGAVYAVESWHQPKPVGADPGDETRAA